MKGRIWFFILGLLGILAVLILINRKAINPGNGQPVKGNLTPQKPITLEACDTSSMSLSGPLVPGENAPGITNQLSEISHTEKVPTSEWSSRAGFSISTATDPEYWAQLLGSAWYIDWAVRTSAPPDHLEHWQMIRVHENCITPSTEVIQTIASTFSGQVWIIGNEPDVIWQDNVSAPTYAVVYHDLYELIKSIDPTALIAVGGISQPTPLRLVYLDQVLHTYQEVFDEPMPVDWWTIHGYVLREEKGSWGVDIPPGINEVRGEIREVMDHGNIDLFKAQILSFRNWMAENGYQNSPLALTEFGILMPFTYGFPADLIAGYLEQTFLWLSQAQDDSTGYPDDGYHLVQKWAWFSISDPTYSSSNLGDLSSGNLTLVGERFRSMIPLLEK